jgi:hypothetical protein
MPDPTCACEIAEVGDSDGCDDCAVLDNAMDEPFLALVMITKSETVAFDDDFNLCSY